MAAGTQTQVNNIALRVSTGNQAHITAINVWDGNSRIAIPTSSLPISSGTATTYNWTIPSTPIHTGLGISIAVTFDASGQGASGAWVSFVGAGAQFVT